MSFYYIWYGSKRTQKITKSELGQQFCLLFLFIITKLSGYYLSIQKYNMLQISKIMLLSEI
jgi:hypothetical protein